MLEEKSMRAPAILGMMLLALTAGCTTMTPQERRAADETTCRSYGFRKGTDAFASCLLQLDLDRRATRRAALYSDPFYDPYIVYRPVVVRP
jgi:hypothetical protein